MEAFQIADAHGARFEARGHADARTAPGPRPEAWLTWKRPEKTITTSSHCGNWNRDASQRYLDTTESGETFRVGIFLDFGQPIYTFAPWGVRAGGQAKSI